MAGRTCAAWAAFAGDGCAVSPGGPVREAATLVSADGAARAGGEGRGEQEGFTVHRPGPRGVGRPWGPTPAYADHGYLEEERRQIRA